MNDKDNIKELIGARFEEIHLSETMTETLPSDEEILRWETLARARHAQKQRNKRRLLSLAAVFLLAVVISVAVIVSPPDAEAGGNGKAVIVDNKDGVMIAEYDSLEDLETKGHTNFIIIKDRELVATDIQYTKTNNIEQLEVVYKSDDKELVLTEIIGEDNFSLKNVSGLCAQKEEWNYLMVDIVEDPNYKEKMTYCFITNDIYVNVYTETMSKREVRKVIEETF